MVTVEEYLKKAYTTVELPSGFKFKIKTLSSIDVLKVMGDIPSIQEMTNLNKEEVKENVQKLSANKEYTKKIIEVVPELVEKSIIEPKGIKWEQLDGKDKDALMEYILSQFTADKKISSFREKEQ
ncbi:hypothetical protein [Methanothermococcus okinawensis]|uniref:Uncharacterized protein n=1 Tax=Methanothermococcus okinawensis (strain DSM 14208 / JCM 11175 / IH1) TaxID=647113 RepID=F8AKA4_METOI|nr:hypothetical protein [Methanothermococcus okinawensis]AEH06304.1 hypothetical protein Metok_0314 [Methanothermococcus okinawensis IH1]